MLHSTYRSFYFFLLHGCCSRSRTSDFVLRKSSSKGKLEICAAWDFFSNLTFEKPVVEEKLLSVLSVLLQFETSAVTKVTCVGKISLWSLRNYSLDIKVLYGHGLWHFSDSLHGKDPEILSSCAEIESITCLLAFLNTPASARWTKWQQPLGVDLWGRALTLDLLRHLSSPLPVLYIFYIDRLCITSPSC